jgi:hypothetical protein
MQFFHDNDKIMDFGCRPSSPLRGSIADSSIGTPLEDVIKWYRGTGKKEVLPRNKTLRRKGNDTRFFVVVGKKERDE